jgi:lysozyme
VKTNRDGLKIIDRYLLKNQMDTEAAEKLVEHFVTVELNENQFSALVSFVKCRGATAFRRSVLLRRVNQNQPFQAAEQFKLWVNHGGKRRKSLINRRKSEEKLFLRPVIVADKGKEYATPSPL